MREDVSTNGIHHVDIICFVGPYCSLYTFLCLQAYFAAYAVAVRYAIAKKTREVLKEGEDGSGINVTYPNIPDSMTLQEFALRMMMSEKAFDRIVIGASTMQDFQHHSHLMETLGSEENPLEAIDSLQTKESPERSEKAEDNSDNKNK